jgi:DNA-directed RNA polymerase specialized sigma subunit
VALRLARGPARGPANDTVVRESVLTRARKSLRVSPIVDQNLTQRAFTTILEHFVANGRAPHYAELADALGIGSEEAREVQRAAVEAAPIASCWLAHDTEYIESWAPFSNVPTHYLISVDGIQKWYGQ